MYFGAYPGGWEESCPWVTLDVLKYTGPEIQCPGGPGLQPWSCSWLVARITYAVFDAGRVRGGGVEMESTSVVHMRAAKSFRKEGELTKMI